MNVVTARAHTNIALVKYWGKADDQLIIPQTSSISLTLDRFYTDTSVIFDSVLSADQFWLNGQLTHSKRVTEMLNLVRQMANINLFARITSDNHVPTSAGLASSASAFAALAAAASKAAHLDLSLRDLSRLARRGSGSACRSIFGNFVEWHRGTNDLDSFAEPIESDSMMDIEMIAVVIDHNAKSISSRKGMASSVATSPYYPAWKKVVAQDLKTVKAAIKNNDFTVLGHTAELNAMRMHALTMSADPDYLYLNGDSIKIINIVQQLRQSGIECYYTMDAGPNVKIICQSHHETAIYERLQQNFNVDDILITKPGKGIEYIHKS